MDVIAASATFWLGEAADRKVWATMCRASMAACIMAADQGMPFGNAMVEIEAKTDRACHFLYVAETALEHLDYMPERPFL